MLFLKMWTHLARVVIASFANDEITVSKRNTLAYINKIQCKPIKSMTAQTKVPYIIKLITAVIYSFRNKLDCFSLNIRLGWKGLQGTNTLAYYRNRKLRT
jgi:hypothetical protein